MEEVIRSLALDTVGLGCLSDVEMRAANGPWDQWAWGIYLLYLVIVCHTLSLSKEPSVCGHSTCIVCTLMTEMVSGIELQSLVSSVFLPDVAKESVSSLPL